MTPASAQEDGLFREAADLLDEGVREEAYAAAVLLVGRGDEVLFERSAGYARSASLFDIASLTKPLTAALFFVLSQEGHLSPDGIAAEVLPFTSPDPRAREIRFAHLLSHTSGLPAWLAPVPEVGGCGNGGRKAAVRHGGGARSNSRRRPLPPSVARPRGRLGIQRSRVHAARPRDRGRRLPLPRPAARGDGHRPPRDAGDPVPAPCRDQRVRDGAADPHRVVGGSAAREDRRGGRRERGGDGWRGRARGALLHRRRSVPVRPGDRAGPQGRGARAEPSFRRGDDHAGRAAAGVPENAGVRHPHPPHSSPKGDSPGNTPRSSPKGTRREKRRARRPGSWLPPTPSGTSATPAARCGSIRSGRSR